MSSWYWHWYGIWLVLAWCYARGKSLWKFASVSDFLWSCISFTHPLEVLSSAIMRKLTSTGSKRPPWTQQSAGLLTEQPFLKQPFPQMLQGALGGCHGKFHVCLGGKQDQWSHQTGTNCQELQISGRQRLKSYRFTGQRSDAPNWFKSIHNLRVGHDDHSKPRLPEKNEAQHEWPTLSYLQSYKRHPAY